MKFRKILPIIGIIILIIILFSLDFDKIIEVFTSINPWYSFLCFFIIVPIIFMANVEWQLLLHKQKIHVSFWYSIKNYFIGYFYGFITPGALGAYTRALYLEEKSKAPLLKCVSNIIILNTIDYISLLILGAIGAIFLSSIFPYLFYTIVFFIIIFIALFLFIFKKERSKIFFTKIIQSRLFATVKNRLETSIDSFYEDLPRFKDVLLPAGLSISGWIVKYIGFYFISKLFLINVPFIYFILIMAVADVIASLPISTYGLGTREAALISMLSIYNVIPEKILAFSLFCYVIIWLFPSVIGFFVTTFETTKLNDFSLQDKTIQRFAKYMKKYPELYDNLAVIVKKNIPTTIKKPFIVDLGVGPGLLPLHIFKKIPNAEIVGIDPLIKMLEIANENVKEESFQTMIGTSDKIPLEKNSADIIVSRFSLSYWDKPKESFKEINRVLKSGGRVILECLNKDFSKWKLFLIKIRMFFKLAGSDVIRYHADAYKIAYTRDSVKKLFNDTGFKIIFEEENKKDWKFIVIAEK